MSGISPELSLTFRDILYFGALLVSIALSYGRLRSDIRHLDDIKADRRELELLGAEIRQRLADILTSLARVEQSIRLDKQRLSGGEPR
jgi:hypothetical protein